MGGFYRLADEVVDNSYGEPMLKDSIWDYVHEFERSFKYFEFGTNGSLLHSENRKRLLGNNAVLYVSADAADPERFSRYRNSDFSQLMENLKSLCEERAAHRSLPKALISYVTMRSNQDQVGPFLALMPIARWPERGGRPLEEFLWNVWNGERYQAIRSSLARGQLPELCRMARSCPIVWRRFERFPSLTAHNLQR